MGNVSSIIKDVEKSNIIKSYEAGVKTIKNLEINCAIKSYFNNDYVKELCKSKKLFNDSRRVYIDKIDKMTDSKPLTKQQLYQLHTNIIKKFDNYVPEYDFTYGTKMYFIVNKFLENLINIKIFADILKFNDTLNTIQKFRKLGRHYFLLFYICIDSHILICPAIHEDENNNTLVADEFAEKVDFMGVQDDNIVQIIEDPINDYQTSFKVGDNIIGGIDFTILTEGVDLCELYKNKIINHILQTSGCTDIKDFVVELHKNNLHIKTHNYNAKVFIDLNTYVIHLNNLYKQIKDQYRPNDKSEISVLSTSF